MNQIDIVLDAINAGCRTSPEVSLKTGLSVKHCCAWLRELEARGAVECTGYLPASTGPGRRAKFYEPRRFRVIMPDSRKTRRSSLIEPAKERQSAPSESES
jgi:hypothetical protein